MELSKLELEAIQDGVKEDVADTDVKYLESAQLALVGGGCGDVHF